MSIKVLAHLAHQRAVSAAGPAFKRSHFYELMAAAFGYGSYAALGADSVLLERNPPIAESTVGRSAMVRLRCTSLGYGDQVSEVVSSVVCDVLTEQAIDVVRLTDLVDLLREGGDLERRRAAIFRLGWVIGGRLVRVRGHAMGL